MPTRFLLVDTIPHGHHARVLRLCADALSTVAPVNLLLSPALAEAAGYGRDSYAPLEGQRNARQLLATANRHAQRIGADHIVYLYGARSMIVAWLTCRRFPIPASSIIFTPPPLHYPRQYQSKITLAERAGATVKEVMFGLWRRRRDLHSVWTLDAAATARWNRRSGAPAFTLEQPPVAGTLNTPLRQRVAPEQRPFDCVIYGAISARKGLSLLAKALHEIPGLKLRVLIAGRVLAGDRPQFLADVAAIRATGSTVTVREGWIADDEVPGLLGTARCVLLAYPRHTGDSWVLLEAAAARVPVIADSWGLLGHTVRQHDLGLTVDCSNPAAFGAALSQIRLPSFEQDHQAPIAGFAARHDRAAFVRSVIAPFTGAQHSHGHPGQTHLGWTG